METYNIYDKLIKEVAFIQSENINGEELIKKQDVYDVIEQVFKDEIKRVNRAGIP